MIIDSEKKISVIIPCFNNEKTIERSIFSILNQTYKNIEILCIDDCSIDNSYELLKKLSKDISNFYFFKNNKNYGPSFSRNKGVSIATGDYFSFLDADDYWHFQKLEIQISKLLEYNLDFLATKSKINVDYHKNKTIKIKDIKLERISFNRLLFKNYFSTSSVLMRRKIFLPFNETQNYSEDYMLWLKISHNTENKIGIISYPPLVYLSKFNYGISGLSGNLWLMEKYELKNYVYFLKKWNLVCVFSMIFSMIKYFRRLILIFCRKCFKD